MTVLKKYEVRYSNLLYKKTLINLLPTCLCLTTLNLVISIVAICQQPNKIFSVCLELFTIFPLRLNVPRGLMHIPHYLWIRHLVISILRYFAKGEEINLFKKIASFVPTFIMLTWVKWLANSHA